MTAFANPDTYRAPLNKNVRLNKKKRKMIEDIYNPLSVRVSV